MIAKLSITLRHSVWLLALLIITSALPAHAQDDEDIKQQEGQFNFEYSDDLNGYIISPNKLDGWNWDGNEPYLFIPSTRLLDGKPVVGLSGFESLKYLDLIAFESPCHVKYICDKCFQYCTSLGSNEGLTLPETVETIGDYAFLGCTRLRSINFGSNLKSIGKSAFEECTSLESITLPNSLKVIREFAFRNCANYDNWGNFTGGGLQSVKFEDGVDFYTTNGVYCFYDFVFWGCANLSSVTLPNNTPGDFIIPPGTFGYCGNLKSITFPKNTCKIEQLAFYRTGLESLDLTNIELAEEKPFYLSGYYTFAACENLKTITAKGKVRFIGLYTFQDCKALETVTFTGSGDDYTEMNPDAFKYCDNLKSVEFYRLKGNGQSNDMDSVFTGCKSLERVTSTCTPEISKIGYSCFDGCTSLTTLSLPETKFAVNETAFRNCAALKSFDFTNVTSIGKATFSGCTGLTSLDFTDLTSIDTEAFKDCTALTSVNFNTSSETSFTSSIGSKAFTGCTALKSLNFNSSSYDPPTVDSEDAFDATHYATTKVNMPEERYRDFAGDAIWNKFVGLKHPALFAYNEVGSGYSISKGQYALDEDFTDMLMIPEQYNSGDVVAIAEGAFQGLTGLTGVTLPEKIASIGSNAFGGCTNVGTVINKRRDPISGDICPNDAFDSKIYTNGTLYVPFGSLDAYNNVAPWSSFSNEIKQGFGERILSAPEASRESGVFYSPFELTLTNPNDGGTIYYYIISEGDNSTDVRTVNTYSEPITISSASTVVAYISDDTSCCEPVSFVYTPTPNPSIYLYGDAVTGSNTPIVLFKIEDGVYEFKGELKAGGKFKFFLPEWDSDNHDWSNTNRSINAATADAELGQAGLDLTFTYPADQDNYWKVAEDAGGYYTITVNIKDKKVKAEYKGTEFSSILPLYDLYIYGDATATGWDIQNAEKIEKCSENVYRYTGDLKEGQFRFLTTTLSPFALSVKPAGSSSVYVNTSGFSNGEVAYCRVPDISWNVEDAGYYTLNLDLEAMTLDATDYMAELPTSATAVADNGTSDYYATFSNIYSDMVLSVETGTIEVYNVKVSGDKLVLIKREDTKVACGEGVLVKASTPTINVTPLSGEALTPAVYGDETLLVATPVSATTVTADGDYLLYRLTFSDKTNQTGLGFYYGSNDGKSLTFSTPQPNKAYLKVPSTIAAQIKGFSLNPHPSHVDGINAEEQSNNEPIYDLSGRRVENPTKGFYLQGNKKIIVK